MSTLDELKKEWENTRRNDAAYNEVSLARIVKSRITRNTNTVIRYFWGSFVLQLIVYALLCHVAVKYWSNTGIVLSAIAGILLYVPFTVMLMTKFKRMAVAKLSGTTMGSIQEHVSGQRKLLQSFFRFKKLYEVILIPLSAAIDVGLVFTLYVPGGMLAHASAVLLIYALTLTSCFAAIYSEDKKHFKQPLEQFNAILEEYT